MKIPDGSFENLQLIIEGANSINGNYSCIQVEDIRINGVSIDSSNFAYTNGGLNNIGVPFSYNGSVTISKTAISSVLSQKYDYGQVNCIGGSGIDILDYAGISSEGVTWTLNDQGKWLIKSSAYKIDDIASEIERLNFANKKIALALNGNAGTTAKILGAVFGKDSLTNKQYVGIGLSLLDAGMSTNTLSSLAVDAANLKTNDQIVLTLWKNIFGTTASISDKAPYVKLLDDGMSVGTLAWLAADTPFNKVNINLVGLAQTGIEYIPVS